jgi:death-on-curing protein
VRYLVLAEVLELHRLVMAEGGGSPALRDAGALLSSLAQPRTTFEGNDLYPTIAEKAATLCFSIVTNHPFVDGNKRVGHAAMETFLVLNGFELVVDVDSAEQTILGLASGKLTRSELTHWVRTHIQPLKADS